MKYCTKCGSSLNDDAKFCNNCGTASNVASNTTNGQSQADDFVSKIADLNNTADTTAEYTQKILRTTKSLLFSHTYLCLY